MNDLVVWPGLGSGFFSLACISRMRARVCVCVFLMMSNERDDGDDDVDDDAAVASLTLGACVK